MAGSKGWLIAGGRIIDPSREIDLVGDLVLRGGEVVGVVGRDCGAPEDELERLEARGCVVSPGFVDLHAHLREPGGEHAETIRSGTRAAAAGGFTTVCALADTDPAIDSRGLVEHVRSLAAAEGVVRVLPYGAITKARAGKELAEMGEMADAGVIGFSDDPRPVANSRLMRHALEYARAFGRPVASSCDDPSLSVGGAMHDGPVASALGLRGMPAAGEEAAVARDVALCELTGARVHVAHVSTAGAVEQIRRAKSRGLRVTAEATPHHLTMTERWVAGERFTGRSHPYDANTKVAPPLRSQRDCEALVAALRDGTIDAIATDHLPQASVDKQCEYDAAAFGISGLETALGTLLRLVESGELELRLVLEKLTIGPCRAFGLPFGTLRPGACADVVVFDPSECWRVEPAALRSSGKNTPLLGEELPGRVVATFSDGRLVHAVARGAGVAGGVA